MDTPPSSKAAPLEGAGSWSVTVAVWWNLMLNFTTLEISSDFIHTAAPPTLLEKTRDMQSNAIRCRRPTSPAHTGLPQWGLIKAATAGGILPHLCCRGPQTQRQTELLRHSGRWCFWQKRVGGWGDTEVGGGSAPGNPLRFQKNGLLMLKLGTLCLHSDMLFNAGGELRRQQANNLTYEKYETKPTKPGTLFLSLKNWKQIPQKSAFRQVFVCWLPALVPVSLHTSCSWHQRYSFKVQSVIAAASALTGQTQQHGHKSKVSWEPLVDEQAGGDVSLWALKCKAGEGCVYMTTLCLSIKHRGSGSGSGGPVFRWQRNDWAPGSAQVARQSNSPTWWRATINIGCHIFLQLLQRWEQCDNVCELGGNLLWLLPTLTTVWPNDEH